MKRGLSARAAAAAVLLSGAGCGTGPAAPAALVQMAPLAANNDIQLAALIYGTSFRPAYRFDAVSGNASVDVNGFSAWLSQSTSPPAGAPLTEVPLSAVVWEAESMLQAVLPAGIAAGSYDLVVRDPRGQTSRLAAAFDSLGPDLTPPVVTIGSPGNDTVVGAQAAVAVIVQVDDGIGQVVSLQVNVRTDTATILPYACSAAAQARTACTFSFVAPAPSASAAALYIDATAIDGGGNTGTAEVVLDLVPAPQATSLSPASGSTLGGTRVTVLGTGFIPGATSVLFDGVAAPTSDQSPTSITSIAPSHLAGSADVTVSVGGSVAHVQGGFLYLVPPTVRAIDPAYGPVAGGTMVSVVGDNFTALTQILIGTAALVGSTYQNPNLIQGITPPGTGDLLVGAFDPVLGVQTNGTVSFAYGADGGGPPIPCLPEDGCAGGGP